MATNLQNARLHGEVARQITEPADAHLAAVKTIQRAGEARAIRDRQRRTPVESGLHVEQIGNILHGTPHRPFSAQLADPGIGRRPHRYPALAWAQAKNVVPARWVAQTAHEIGAVCDRQQAQGQCHRGAATAAPGRARRVIGIAGYAEHLIEGVRAQAELRRVGLADHNTAGRFHALHQQAILCRNKIAQQWRTLRGGNAGDVAQVFDRLRHAVHPAHRLAARQLRIALVSLA